MSRPQGPRLSGRAPPPIVATLLQHACTRCCPVACLVHELCSRLRPRPPSCVPARQSALQSLSRSLITRPICTCQKKLTVLWAAVNQAIAWLHRDSQCVRAVDRAVHLLCTGRLIVTAQMQRREQAAPVRNCTLCWCSCVSPALGLRYNTLHHSQ